MLTRGESEVAGQNVELRSGGHVWGGGPGGQGEA